MIKKLHRRSIRLPNYDYTQPRAYFVTVCTKNRKHLFGKIVDGAVVLNYAGGIVGQVWGELPKRFPNIELDAFVVMPNHFHGIIIITNRVGMNVGAIHELPLHETPLGRRTNRRRMLLPKIVGYFKMNIAKKINILHNTPGVPIWQRNYYEHVIRSDKINQTRQYIMDNPANWDQDENNPKCLLTVS